VIWLFGGRAAWWQVFLIALPTAAALAFLSWHLVERPMLRLKPGERRSAAGYATAAQQA
jgi:peptidoglycan/LPS O-acetylase OafA/YrhL